MGEKEYEYIYQIVKDSDGVYCYIKQGELIRCKDCKHYEWMSNRIPEERTWHCHCWDADTGKDDFYCGLAERRTDD